MLESIFLMLMCMGFLLFIIGIFEESIIFSSVSILLWIMVMAGLVYIEVPYHTAYTELGLIGVSLGFIFINIMWILVQYGYLIEDWQHP